MFNMNIALETSLQLPKLMQECCAVGHLLHTAEISGVLVSPFSHELLGGIITFTAKKDEFSPGD